MKLNIGIYSIILITTTITNVFAQSTSNNLRKGEVEEHHKNEIGLANSIAYFVKEKEVSYGLHIHFIKSISNTKFGIGIGYEKIFDEHQHNTFGVVGSYRPIHNLCFVLSPGVTFEKENKTPLFALHFETTYEWEINNIHIGPAIEAAYDIEDYHISAGVHIGFGF